MEEGGGPGRESKEGVLEERVRSGSWKREEGVLERGRGSWKKEEEEFGKGYEPWKREGGPGRGREVVVGKAVSPRKGREEILKEEGGPGSGGRKGVLGETIDRKG